MGDGQIGSGGIVAVFPTQSLIANPQAGMRAAEVACAGIPVMGHIGLVPRKSTWTGGLRAVGKTFAQATSLYGDLKALENAGAWAVECEVIPSNVMGVLARRTGLVTISLGSGPDCDVQHLFADDILGVSDAVVPRHAKRYRNLFDAYQKLQSARIAGFADYAQDVRCGNFPTSDYLLQADSDIVSELENLIIDDLSKH